MTAHNEANTKPVPIHRLLHCYYTCPSVRMSPTSPSQSRYTLHPPHFKWMSSLFLCLPTVQKLCRYISYAKNYLLLAQDPVVVLLRVLRRNRCPLPSAWVLLVPPPPPAPGTSLLWVAAPLLLRVDWIPPKTVNITTIIAFLHIIHRYGLTLSIVPNWVGSTWRWRQNPVSEMCVLNRNMMTIITMLHFIT
jgi:hypothetical protein